MSEFSAALKKDPVNKKIVSTAKRLRDEEDYDEDESRKRHQHKPSKPISHIQSLYTLLRRLL